MKTTARIYKNCKYLKITFLVASLIPGFFLPPKLEAATYYVSPTGTIASGSTCSSGSPCSVNYMTAQAAAGDTWLFKNGTYSPISLNCSANFRNGTSGSPITLQADNERQAKFLADGMSGAFFMENCNWIRVIGLAAENVDNNSNTSGIAAPFSFYNSSNLTISRLIASKPNRYVNDHCITIGNVSNSVITENEYYACHRHGMYLGQGSSGNYVARNYGNKRYSTFPPLVATTGGGSSGITCYPCKNNLIVNNIEEGWVTSLVGGGSGYDIQPTGDASGNRYLGNIALNVSFGMAFNARTEPSVLNETLTNFAVIGCDTVCFSLRSPLNVTCTNCTAIGSSATAYYGFGADHESDEGAPPYSISATNSLVMNVTTQYGFRIEGGSGWSGTFDHNNAYNNAVPYSFGSGITSTNNTQINPSLGACKIFIPEGSPMKRAGAGGADIGANVLYQYNSTGNLTSTPLWNSSSGAFLTQGAIVGGLNDVGGSSLYDIQNRLNVNQNGCALPSGYAVTSTTSPPSPGPSNLKFK